ncbi:DMT family transporter [Sphingomonas piscis]|uniref:DMT family transporter n=1 Tax=Sphingomonas piscis TaxID=2714943 RepID=A0A6G7YNA1_9SPHN|nr:DMT family transporter [Sphingomonas piscis]QIK78214.1 DMT family transporter [Sphingomonas piscis]
MTFDTDRPAKQRPLAAIGLRLITAILLALMFAMVKLASTRGVNLVETLFYRQLGSAVCATALVAGGAGFASLRTKRVGAHVLRMGLGMTSMALNFLAMIMLPLADATAIGFSVPIFSTLLAALTLGEATGRWRWGAVLAGFVGVLLIIQPGRSVVPLGGSVAVAGALLTASVTIMIRRLGATERAATTVFWFAISSLVPMGLLMLWFAEPHDNGTWAVLLAMALTGGLAQLTLTASLRLAPVALVMPMDYTSLLWATLLGVWLFAELPTHSTWLGAPVIIGSGLVILWREHRRARRSASEVGMAEAE